MAAPDLLKSIHSERYVRFCELLVAARKHAGLTQTIVAERLGRPPSFVAKIELGDRRLDVLEFLEVARVIGFDPADLLRQLEEASGATVVTDGP